jgi:hypothetical protein
MLRTFRAKGTLSQVRPGPSAWVGSDLADNISNSKSNKPI